MRWRVWLTDRFIGDWLTDKAYYRARFLGEPHRQSRPADPTGHRRVHGRHGQGPNNPMTGTAQHPVVRVGELDRVRAVLRADPVEPVRTADPVRGDRPQGAVLAGAGLCVLRQPRGVLARTSADPVEFPQRAHQRGVSLRRWSGCATSGKSVAFYARRGRRATAHCRGACRTSSRTTARTCAARSCCSAGTRRSARSSPAAADRAGTPVVRRPAHPRRRQQSASAFSAVHDSLSFFRIVYDSFAGYRATIIRLHGLVEANEKARSLSTLTVDTQPRRCRRTRRRRGRAHLRANN